MPDLEYETSSSEEDLPKTPSLCMVSCQNNEFVISAKSTTDYAIRMEQDSFVFKREKSNIVLQFNRMFLWRLLNSTYLNKNEDFNFSRLRDFITRIHNPIILISVIDGYIQFNFNGQEQTYYIPKETETELQSIYDQLYFTTMHKYKVDDFLDKILITSIQLLNIIRAHF